MKRTWKKWTPEEDALLAELWNTPGPMKTHLDKFSDRSEHAVVSRAAEIGLGKRPKRSITQSSATNAAIMRALAIGPMDAVEISAKSGVERNHVSRRLKSMHANAEVYIVKWERFSVMGRYTRIWAIGSEKDAVKPTPPTQAVRERRRMKRMKLEDPERYEQRLARRRIQRADRAGTLIRRDPAVQALFGSAP
jgi:hypothetical protein